MTNRSADTDERPIENAHISDILLLIFGGISGKYRQPRLETFSILDAKALKGCCKSVTLVNLEDIEPFKLWRSK